MKHLIITILTGILLFSCKEKTEENKDMADVELEANIAELPVFGKDFKNETTLTAYELGDIYSNLKAGDTINVTFEGPVQEVCQAKGCWMQIDVGSKDPVMVKFKDYGFFVPKDIKDRNVVVHGVAFVSETTVDEQRHYAADAGKTQAEIAQITKPKKTLGFTASGVKIAE